MGYRCYVFDDLNLQPDDLQGSNGGLSPRPWTLYVYVDFPQSMLNRLPGCGFRGYLGRKRCALLSSTEIETPCTRPGYRVAHFICNIDNRVVECSLDMNDTLGNVLFFSLLRFRSYFSQMNTPLLLLSCNGFFLSLSRPCIRPRPLPSNRQTLPVPESAV